MADLFFRVSLTSALSPSHLTRGDNPADMHEQDPVHFPIKFSMAHTFGLLMIALGVIMLALATWQHRQMIRYLNDGSRLLLYYL